MKISPPLAPLEKRKLEREIAYQKARAEPITFEEMIGNALGLLGIVSFLAAPIFIFYLIPKWREEGGQS